MNILRIVGTVLAFANLLIGVYEHNLFAATGWAVAFIFMLSDTLINLVGGTDE